MFFETKGNREDGEVPDNFSEWTGDISACTLTGAWLRAWLYVWPPLLTSVLRVVLQALSAGSVFVQLHAQVTCVCRFFMLTATTLPWP